MSRAVWIALCVACAVLAGFMLYLTLAHPERPLRGFLIVAALLLVGAFPLSKAREPKPSEGAADDRAAPPPS